jgi:hypothetical protein
MKKAFLIAVFFLLLAFVFSPAYAAVGARISGTIVGAATDIDFGPTATFDGSLLKYYSMGPANIAGASTTVASGTAVIPITGYSVVVKNISEKVGSVATVANGVSGQVLQIVALTLTGSDTLIITPATTSGFTTVTLSAAKQSVTLLYLNDTLGWVVIGTANNPTVA